MSYDKHLDTIILQCPRPDLSTTHVRLTMFGDGLAIDYGTFRLATHGMRQYYLFQARVGDVEFLSSFQHPELFDLHDGYGWNAIELAAWIDALRIGPGEFILTEEAVAA